MITNPQTRLNSRESSRSPINEVNNDVRSSFQSISNAQKKDDTQAINPIYVDQITINGKTGMGADKITQDMRLNITHFYQRTLPDQISSENFQVHVVSDGHG